LTSSSKDRPSRVPPAERLRAAVAGYPLEVLSDAIADALHIELVGARLVAVWALEGPADAGRLHPLTAVQVEAILARLRTHLV